MRRLLGRVPLTPLGWILVVLVIALAATAAIAGSGTLALVAALGLCLVLLIAIGAPRSIHDLQIPPRMGVAVMPPEDDHPDR